MLLFADANSHLPPSAEVKRYRSANSKDKPLQQFLSSLITQCEQQVQGPLLGLNFGRLLNPQAIDAIKARGHQLNQYDPHFAPDHTLLRLEYDFIC